PLSGCIGSFELDMGVGGQTFNLLVDTGSATTAVAGTGCGSCAGAGGELYEAGPTATDLETPAPSTYGVPPLQASWQGEVYRDILHIPASDIAFPFNLVAIEQETHFFSPTPCNDKSPDGILGLASPEALARGTDGFIEELIAVGMPNIFAVQLCDRGGRLWL